MLRKYSLVWILLCVLLPSSLYAEIHPISGWDLQVDISGSGAGTVWLVTGFTFIDYNIPGEDIVTGISEGGGVSANVDNLDLHLFDGRANENPPYVQTTMFGGESLWSDGNGDKYDFFVFENSNPNQTENLTIQAILADGTLGRAIGVVGADWEPSRLDPPEPTMRDELGLVRSVGPQNGKGPWGIAFKVTDLMDAEGNPLTNNSLIQGIRLNSAGGDFNLICAAKSGGPPVALNPVPGAGATATSSTVALSWDAGNRMVSQKVYLSSNLGDVASGAEAALIAPEHTEASLDVQVEGGLTYYWRVDTVNDEDSVAPGNVWSFQTVPSTASQPTPYDGALFVNTTPTLSWTSALDAQSYTVILGTDQAVMAGATEGVEVTDPNYTPDPLTNETVYYWRVDVFDGTTTHTGTVWQFTTARATGGLLGRYYHDEFGPLIETRIDPEINFFWDANDTNHLTDGPYSIRWQGELEVPADGDYTFTLTSSDWARLYIDGVLVVNDWNTHGTRDASGSIELSAGLHGVTVDFYRDDEPGEVEVTIRLWWENDLFSREIVPFGALIPEPKAVAMWPLNGADEIAQSVRLQWMGTDPEAKFQVYLGTSADTLSLLGEVEEDTSYLAEGLNAGTMYYWRVDEILGGQTTQGRLLTFTTANDLVIDDGENYTGRDDQAIWATWFDGYAGNGTGSLAGLANFPYVEENIVHSGRQSLPLVYDNTGQFMDIDGKVSGATHSEISRSVQPQDWSGQKTLQLWYHGADLQNFTYDAATQTYTVQGVGAGLANDEDNGTYVYGQLTGDGTIVARVESPAANQTYANAARIGVLLRETLDPDAKSIAMTLSGNAQVRTIWRTDSGGIAEVFQVQTAVWLPHYVRIVREGDMFRTSYSPDGFNWAGEEERTISMDATIHIGLVVSSGSADAAIEVKFTDVQVTGTVVEQPFAEFKVLGAEGIAPERFYVKLKDSAGGEAIAVHPDADAIQSTVWKPWSIDLQALAGQGVSLGSISELIFGIGEPGITGNIGTVYLDDIRLLTE